MIVVSRSVVLEVLNTDKSEWINSIDKSIWSRNWSADCYLKDIAALFVGNKDWLAWSLDEFVNF